MHAPKQKGNVKEQLRYIGRYIRRPAIGINRIEAYDGQYVTFKYKDKTDGKEKTETVSVEEFISRLIRHIPDEQFKTIRHYGMYSRRSKNLCKKVLCLWQQKAKRWIIKVKKTLRRQTWRERIIASGKKDPLVCPRCECYYEYKGEVCLEDGKLEIKVALCPTTRVYLERVINDLTSIKVPQKGKEKKKNINLNQSKKQSVSYVCLACHEKEEIPLNIVRDFDLMDDGDPTTPPMFSCEKCGGEMYPEYYKGVHGIEYKLSDIR